VCKEVLEKAMKGTLSLFGAVIIYAAFNVVYDLKFRGVMQVASMSVYIGVLAAISVVAYLLRGQLGLTGTLPSGPQVWILVGIGVVLFIGDVFFLTAYNEKISLLVITTSVMLIPVVATAMKFFIGGTLPTPAQMLGYLLVAGGMYLVVAKG
jgi:drug/metabolite transporter (DMT)-like permease